MAPAGLTAAGLAGLASLLRQGEIDLKGQRVVAVCTGHGLKDPDIITRTMPAPAVLPATLEALEEVIRET